MLGLSPQFSTVFTYILSFPVVLPVDLSLKLIQHGIPMFSLRRGSCSSFSYLGISPSTGAGSFCTQGKDAESSLLLTHDVEWAYCPVLVLCLLVSVAHGVGTVHVWLIPCFIRSHSHSCLHTHCVTGLCI